MQNYHESITNLKPHILFWTTNLDGTIHTAMRALHWQYVGLTNRPWCSRPQLEFSMLDGLDRDASLGSSTKCHGNGSD